VQNQKFYSTSSSQIFSGIALLISIFVFFIPVNLQIGKPFDLQLFLLGLLLMSVSIIFCFYFLRNLFCPVVQVYKSEIIISKYTRLRVPKTKIRELAMEKGRVKILYVEGKDLKEIVVAVRDNKEEEPVT
jgi:Na+/melibiose symporter-like transporter